MIEIVDLEDKHPDEKVEYQYDLTRISAFNSGADVLDANAEWYVYDTADVNTNLASTMVYAYDYSATDHIVKVTIQGGTSGKYYYLVAKIPITLTGRVYLQIGKFYVNSLGIDV